MAEILIKGMEMPKSCGECRFAVNAYGSQTEGKCAVLGYGVTYMRERHDACPLVAVPPHEELILRQDVIQVLKDTCEEGCIDRYTNNVRRAIFDEVLEVIEDKEILPTVLEASK